MTSLYKIYNSSKLEAQKNYFSYLRTVLFQEDNYIPSWIFENTDTIDSIYIQEIDETALINDTITVNENTLITGYTTSVSGNCTYANKKAYTLDPSKIYRIAINVDTGTSIDRYYGELFKKIET